MVGSTAFLLLWFPVVVAPLMAVGIWWFGYHRARRRAALGALAFLALVAGLHFLFLARHVRERSFLRALRPHTVEYAAVDGRQLSQSEVEDLIASLRSLQWYAEEHDVWVSPRTMTIQPVNGKARSYIVVEDVVLPGVVIHFCSSVEDRSCPWGGAYSAGLGKITHRE